MADIKTQIFCENIAPIENLNKEIQSGTLKIGIFANNGSGKTFISRLFRLTEKKSEIQLNEDTLSQTDKFISLGKNNAKFKFKVTDKEGIVKDDFSLDFSLGSVPTIPTTYFLYHTFNQEYVDDNIRTLNYEKDGNIDGFILGKGNIDLKDEEDKLVKNEEDGLAISEQVRTEIKHYLKTNIDNIQNIQRLGEYKNITYEEIVFGLNAEPLQVSKAFDELIADYNKIKSVPENLLDIQKIDKVELNLKQFSDLKELCEKEFTLSVLAEEFKEKIKAKQGFIETGIGLISNNKCPFCEQPFNDNALKLIDNFTKYLNDSEASTIKLFKSNIKSIEDKIINIRAIETINIKRISEYDTYKTKYIPSCAQINLEQLDITLLLETLNKIIIVVNQKLKDISKPIALDNSHLEELNTLQAQINNLVNKNNKEIDGINGKKNRINDENKRIRKEICNSAFNFLVKEHKTNISNILRLRLEHKQLTEQIKKKKEEQKASKKERVADTIKKVLNYFFSGKYTLNEDTFQLVFKTNALAKNQAKNVLSDGEKNIVAFAYYLGDAHLKVNDEDDYKKLFFIIDDPISSMDFNHVYTMCGIIRDLDKIIEKLGRVKYLLFTHNNDFMRVLSSNNILDKKLILRDGKIEEFNTSLTVPYISHLLDIYQIARRVKTPDHTTANSIRHIIETLTKFDKIEITRDSIAEYIRENILEESRAYTLINDLSHGGWRSEQEPITNEDYKEVCKTIVNHIEVKYKGQVDFCNKTT